MKSEIEELEQQPCLGCSAHIHEPNQIRVLLAAVDTAYLSFQQEISQDMFELLESEKLKAQYTRAERNAVYVSPWLNAIVQPSGAKGYAFIIVTEDFSIKIQKGNPKQPAIYLEMRSHALHLHPQGARGACADAVKWIRDTFFADAPLEVQERIALGKEHLSRYDYHIDWQGGWHPTLTDADENQFIRPAHVKSAQYKQDGIVTGIQFGRKNIVARIYNKTIETTEQHNEEYPKMIAQIAGDRYCPNQPVWRLEYQLGNEALQGFVLKTMISEVHLDDTAETEAELEAEDLPNLGTLEKALHWTEHMLDYLTRRWLRLVEPTEDTNRARWPIHPDWEALREGMREFNHVELQEEQVKLVREARHTGKRRLLANMGAGLATAAWAMVHTDPAQAVREFCRQVERKARQMVAHEEERRRQNKRRLRTEEELRYWESIAQLSAMAGGIFATVGVLDQQFPVVADMADLLVAISDELDGIAKYKGGVQQMLFDKWCKTYKVLPPQKLFKLAA